MRSAPWYPCSMLSLVGFAASDVLGVGSSASYSSTPDGTTQFDRDDSLSLRLAVDRVVRAPELCAAAGGAGAPLVVRA